MEVVPLVPDGEILHQFSVVPLCDEANDGRVIRELLQVAVRRAVCEVCSVEDEQDRSQTRSPGSPRAADNN